MAKNKRHNQQRANPFRNTGNNEDVAVNERIINKTETEVSNEKITNDTKIAKDNNINNKVENRETENTTQVETPSDETNPGNNENKEITNKTKNKRKSKTLEELIEEAKQGPARSTALGIERYIKNSTSAGVDIKKIGNAQYDLYRTMISTLRKDGREFKDGITLIEKAFILRPDIFNSVALLRGELEWPGNVDSRNQYAVLVVMFEEISHPGKRKDSTISMDKVYEYLPEKVVENLRSHYRLG